jgi:hypothetical protein
MSGRDLGLVCLERVLSVERYYQSQRPPSTPPTEDAASGRPDARAGEPGSRDQARAPGAERPSTAASLPGEVQDVRRAGCHSRAAVLSCWG